MKFVRVQLQKILLISNPDPKTNDNSMMNSHKRAHRILEKRDYINLFSNYYLETPILSYGKFS